MNKDLAAILNGRMELPFVSRLSGIVQTVEVAVESMDGKMLPERFPVEPIAGWDCLPDEAVQARDLVPDSTQKGILYWEDQGCTPTAKGKAGEYDSKMRLVFWGNKNINIPNPVQRMETGYINHIIRQLVNQNPFNSGEFTRVKVRTLAILPMDKAIFSKYTYDEKVSQYLMHPAVFFAIDFNVHFVIPPVCLNELPSTDNDRQCTNL